MNFMVSVPRKEDEYAESGSSKIKKGEPKNSINVKTSTNFKTKSLFKRKKGARKSAL